MQVSPSALGDLFDGVIHWTGKRLRSQWWVWFLPVGVLYAMMRWPPARIEHLIVAVIALGILAWAIRRPGRALIALIVFMPLQSIGFGLLLRAGVSGQILRPAGGLKELLVFGILISALHALHSGRTQDGKTGQLDAIDKALIAYVGVVTLYMLIPHVFSVLPVSNRWSVRLLSWRADCGYVLLFFAVRHAPIAQATKKRFVQVFMAMACLTIVVAFYQWARLTSWERLVLISWRQVKYQISVLGNDPATVVFYLSYLTIFKPLRVGSIFLSPFDMADFLLIAFAIAVERIARNYRSRWSYVVAGGVLAALFTSRVRADALAAMIVLAVALVPTPNRPIVARLRLLAAVALAAVVAIPSLGGTRFVNAEGGGKSNQVHVQELQAGIHELLQNPLGLGIGNVAGVGDRFVVGEKQLGFFTVDNSVLQVGDELGVQALIPWLVMLVLVWRALGRAAKRADPFAGGIRLALLAVLIAGMYHHVFLGFPVAWALWGAIGLALKPEESSSAEEDERSRGNIAAIDAVPADGLR